MPVVIEDRSIEANSTEELDRKLLEQIGLLKKHDAAIVRVQGQLMEDFFPAFRRAMVDTKALPMQDVILMTANVLLSLASYAANTNGRCGCPVCQMVVLKETSDHIARVTAAGIKTNAERLAAMMLGTTAVAEHKPDQGTHVPPTRH
ncbi:MAG: hypothetical protein ABL901_14485 [Hyphomicrobiaceae bacterium]